MPSASHSELTLTGRLRVGINFGNALLAKRDADGVANGIAIDLAQELARRLEAPFEILSYTSAGQMADGAKGGAWDVAFLATDPARAKDITFTRPYLEVDTTYLVPAGSPLRGLSEVDCEGVRIAVSAKSAYDLVLTRDLIRAQLVRAPGPNESIDLFFAEKLDALAGLRPVLIEVAEKHPGTRVLDGRFAVVQQAVGTPRGRLAAAAYLADFIEDVKAAKLVTQLIEKNGVRGASAL